MTKLLYLVGALAALSACDRPEYDPRGLHERETLLSVSATGNAEARPDRAEFQAGVSTWGPNAQTASASNQRKIGEIVGALRAFGIAERDLQTRALTVQRVDWGDRKGQYQATNVINVTVRDVASAGDAVTAVTSAGANILSGPSLRMSDPEKAANAAYAAAFRAARNRAQAYADVAGMKVARILTIRDAGGTQGDRYLQGAVPVAPPPVVVEQSAANDASARLMPGQTASTVSVQVDFALAPK